MRVNILQSGESFEVPGLTYVWKIQGDDFGWFVDAEASQRNGWVQDSGGNWIFKLPTDEMGDQQGIVRIRTLRDPG